DLKGRSRTELAGLLIVHQKGIEQLMGTAWGLPVKFGTRMPYGKGIRDLLERESPLFDSTFSQPRACTQMEISLTSGLCPRFSDIAGEEDVVRLKAQIADDGTAVTTAQRLELGRLVKAALERRRAVVATHVANALRAVAIDAIVSPVTVDHLVLQLVVLVK